jgi:thiamine pyrophosphokinase
VASRADLETIRSHPANIVAADGGAHHVVAAGRIPDAVIGDFDSLAGLQGDLPPDRLHHIPEQDSTDFEKALSRIRAPLVLGLAFMGARLDHQLAAFHGLIRCAHQPCLLVGENQIAFLAPPDITLELAADSLVSLFPLTRVQATSQGLVWPLDGLDLRPGGVIGTSNRSDASSVVRLTSDCPGLLVILPGQARAAACAALLSAPCRWPVPA